MTKDEFQKAVDDVITDCIRNDYLFSSYARKVTEAVWPLFEAAEKERDALRTEVESWKGLAKQFGNEADALRAKIEAIHSLLDGHESKIIRNAKDGYPEGREPKELTLT